MKKPLIIILSIIGVLLLIGIGVFIYLKNNYLSRDEIVDIVMKEAGEYSDKIHISKIELDKEENLYEVYFNYLNLDAEFEYKIDAKTGKVVYNNFNSSKKVVQIQSISIPAPNNSSSNSTPNSNNNNSQGITLDEAKSIAVNNAGLNEDFVIFFEAKSDFDDGRQIYDIEFLYMEDEYSYEIDATTGEIISYDKENINQ